MFLRRVGLEFDGATAIAQCSADVAERTLAEALRRTVRVYPHIAVHRLTDDSCSIAAPRWVWTAYYCALSLHG